VVSLTPPRRPAAVRGACESFFQLRPFPGRCAALLDDVCAPSKRNLQSRADLVRAARKDRTSPGLLAIFIRETSPSDDREPLLACEYPDLSLPTRSALMIGRLHQDSACVRSSTRPLGDAAQSRLLTAVDRSSTRQTFQPLQPEKEAISPSKSGRCELNENGGRIRSHARVDSATL